jgi:integrase
MSKVPKYRRHKNGQAFVRSVKFYNGQNYYLGSYGSQESKQAYSHVLLKLSAGQDLEAPKQRKHKADPSITELLVAYHPHATQHYTRGGKLSPEFNSMMYALRELEAGFGAVPGGSFGPRLLREYQKRVVAKGWCRRTVNRNVKRIRTFFRWASAEELVPPETYHGLRAVQALALGELGVREKPKVRPVDMKDVEATLPLLPPVVAAMVRVQYLCAMRPSEVCNMTASEIDMTGELWLYRPAEHKNAWRGAERVIAIPKAAQEILLPLLGNAALFVPPPEKGERFGRPGYGPQPGRLDRYNTKSYHDTLKHAIKMANKRGASIPHWHPNQLRHARATEISHRHGRQAAQLWLGHEKLDTTQIYAEHQVQELVRIAQALELAEPESTSAQQ